MSEDKTYHNLINGRLYKQKYKPKPKEPARRGRPRSVLREIFDIISKLPEQKKNEILAYVKSIEN